MPLPFKSKVSELLLGVHALHVQLIYRSQESNQIELLQQFLTPVAYFIMPSEIITEKGYTCIQHKILIAIYTFTVRGIAVQNDRPINSYMYTM